MDVVYVEIQYTLFNTYDFKVAGIYFCYLKNANDFRISSTLENVYHAIELWFAFEQLLDSTSQWNEEENTIICLCIHFIRACSVHTSKRAVTPNVYQLVFHLDVIRAVNCRQYAFYPAIESVIIGIPNDGPARV